MRRSGEGRKRTETRETTVKLSVAWAGDVANVGTARLPFSNPMTALCLRLSFSTCGVRLAWPRTPAFHAGNTGSNPVRRTNRKTRFIRRIRRFEAGFGMSARPADYERKRKRHQEPPFPLCGPPHFGVGSAGPFFVVHVFRVVLAPFEQALRRASQVFVELLSCRVPFVQRRQFFFARQLRGVAERSAHVARRKGRVLLDDLRRREASERLSRTTDTRTRVPRIQGLPWHTCGSVVTRACPLVSSIVGGAVVEESVPNASPEGFFHRLLHDFGVQGRIPFGDVLRGVPEEAPNHPHGHALHGKP